MNRVKYKVDKNGCWICTSHKSWNGQAPKTSVKNKFDWIYRHSYRHHKGEIPKGMVVRHTCDNRMCINPDHLVLGSQYENIQDRVERERSAKGVDHGNSKLTEKDVRAIRRSFDKTTRFLANKYGVCYATILCILKRETWKHVE